MSCTLATDKIRLRKLVIHDAAHMARLLGSDREAILQTAKIPYPCTEEAARAWIANKLWLGGHSYAILQASDDAFTGCIGMAGTADLMEVGYWVGRLYWSRGYATDAVRCVVELASDLGVRQLDATTFPSNAGSARVLEKNGFVRTGHLIRDVPLRGGLRELVLYSRAMRIAASA